MALLAGVNYATGQLHDIARLTAAIHEAGAIAIWDLAHAAGNVPLALHDAGVDAAAWCTYKYLNSGPGALAQLFVHERHADARGAPRLAGWWGNDRATRFEMAETFDPAAGADGWRDLDAADPVAGADRRRRSPCSTRSGCRRCASKSVALTAYLETLDRGARPGRRDPDAARPGRPRRPAVGAAAVRAGPPRRHRRARRRRPTSANRISSGSHRSRCTTRTTTPGARARALRRHQPKEPPMTTIGYAAMIEQFHPTDLLDWCAQAEDGRLRGRVHGLRALPPVDAAAGPERVRLVVHGRARPADVAALRDRRHVSGLPLSPGGHRPRGGDARRDVPGPVLPRAGRRRGAQRARHRRRSGRRCRSAAR